MAFPQHNSLRDSLSHPFSYLPYSDNNSSQSQDVLSLLNSLTRYFSFGSSVYSLRTSLRSVFIVALEYSIVTGMLN